MPIILDVFAHMNLGFIVAIDCLLGCFLFFYVLKIDVWGYSVYIMWPVIDLVIFCDGTDKLVQRRVVKPYHDMFIF